MTGRKPSNRRKMPASERAKQFAPFAAVVGLEVALAKKEKEHSRRARIEMTEDSLGALNEQLAQLYEGDIISVTYYSKGHYETVRGEIVSINTNKRTITVDTTEIHFKDIYKIR